MGALPADMDDPSTLAPHHASDSFSTLERFGLGVELYSIFAAPGSSSFFYLRCHQGWRFLPRNNSWTLLSKKRLSVTSYLITFAQILPPEDWRLPWPSSTVTEINFDVFLFDTPNVHHHHRAPQSASRIRVRLEMNPIPYFVPGRPLTLEGIGAKLDRSEQRTTQSLNTEDAPGNVGTAVVPPHRPDTERCNPVVLALGLHHVAGRLLMLKGVPADVQIVA